MCGRMLVFVRVIPVYPGLGLKLGSRRGIATDLICGRGDRVRLEAPVGGGRRWRPGGAAGTPFFGRQICCRRAACWQAEVLALLEYPCCGTRVRGKPIEVFFGKGLGRFTGGVDHAQGVVVAYDRDRQGVVPAGVRAGLGQTSGAGHGQCGVGGLYDQVYDAPVRGG